MTGFSLTPVETFAGLVVVLVLLVVAWRTAARRARAAVAAAQTGARTVSLAGRVVFNAALIVAAQWTVITHHPGRWLLLGFLSIPALVASYTLTRALTVSTDDKPRRRNGGRP